MRFGVVASILLHFCVLGLAFLKLPDFFRTHIESEPYVPIEIISEAELALKTSVPAMTKTPTPEEKPEPPKPKEISPPEPKPLEAKTPDLEPPPLPKPEEKKPEPKAEKKPELPKEKPKPKEADDLDFDKLSALVNKEKKKEAAEAPSESSVQGDRDQQRVGAGDKLTASDIQKMRAAILRCWNVSAVSGAPDANKLIVSVEFELNRDGSLRGPPRVANALQISLSGNQFWKVAQQYAVRAVVTCAPYTFFPQERYEDWKEWQLDFDPTQAAGY